MAVPDKSIFELGAAQAQTIETRSDKLELNMGLPTKSSVEKLYDEMDYQRACQAFIWAVPAVGVSGWQEGKQAIINLCFKKI